MHMIEQTCAFFVHVFDACNVCYDEQAAGGKRAKPPAVTPQPAKKAKVASAAIPATASTSKPQPTTPAAAAQPGTLITSCIGLTANQKTFLHYKIHLNKYDFFLVEFDIINDILIASKAEDDQSWKSSKKNKKFQNPID